MDPGQHLAGPWIDSNVASCMHNSNLQSLVNFSICEIIKVKLRWMCALNLQYSDVYRPGFRLVLTKTDSLRRPTLMVRFDSDLIIVLASHADQDAMHGVH
jgi:hypothetical protein